MQHVLQLAEQNASAEHIIPHRIADAEAEIVMHEMVLIVGPFQIVHVTVRRIAVMNVVVDHVVA